MTYIREIVSGNTLGKIINLPEEFKNKNLEITIFPIEDIDSSNQNSLTGILNNYSDPQKKNFDKNALKKAFKDAHNPEIFKNISDSVAWQKELRDEWE